MQRIATLIVVTYRLDRETGIHEATSHADSDRIPLKQRLGINQRHSFKLIVIVTHVLRLFLGLLRVRRDHAKLASHEPGGVQPWCKAMYTVPYKIERLERNLSCSTAHCHRSIALLITRVLRLRFSLTFTHRPPPGIFILVIGFATSSSQTAVPNDSKKTPCSIV
jgi:hypothetical protein